MFELHNLSMYKPTTNVEKLRFLIRYQIKYINFKNLPNKKLPSSVSCNILDFN